MSVEELEVLRKKARNRSLLGIFIGIVLTVFFWIILESPFFIFFGIVLGIIISVIISSKPKREFTLAFKNTYVLKSLKGVFTDLVYEPEKGLDRSVIADTQMMYMGDIYSSNDYIEGKYKDINVVQADVHIEEEHESTDSDGDTTTTYVTIFMGRWMVFDFNKPFKANIQVSQKEFSNNKVSNWGSSIKYKKVAMEDQDFNNKFRVYAQDEIEAFYVLTPSLMERIKKLSSTIKGSLLFCFVDNKLHIGIYNNEDSFEHGIFTKINEEKIMNEISTDIKLITNFVDELSLDNDLFRRKV
ncbi:MAG: DUF3137 domain-containing protein [Firmicutes bacterium]|nr:DUF3137 domain-containing protein [Bacillota bacterium]